MQDKIWMKIGSRNIIKGGTDKMTQILQTAMNERADRCSTGNSRTNSVLPYRNNWKDNPQLHWTAFFKLYSQTPFEGYMT